MMIDYKKMWEELSGHLEEANQGLIRLPNDGSTLFKTIYLSCIDEIQKEMTRLEKANK